MNIFNQYSFPSSPGVYIFKDMYGVFLYIGKAKNIKKRLKSYDTHKQVDWKIEMLLKNAISIEWIITKNEHEALLLEAQLISIHKPYYNSLLSGDNPFIYLVVEHKKQEVLPSIKLVKSFTDLNYKKDFVWGPFLNKRHAYSLLDYVLTLFNLHRCNKKIDHGCLAYHIGKCSGTCLKNFDFKGYNNRFLLAKALLLNDHNEFFNVIHKKIEEAKKNYNFEELKQLYEYKQSSDIFFAEINARIYEKEDDIEKIISLNNQKNETIQQGLAQLKDLLEVKNDIKKIDCIDISHFQGYATVGSVIRFYNGSYIKSQSKTYSLPNASHDDYQNIKNIIMMRYGINKNEFNDLPDVLMIDGGKGQLHAALEILSNNQTVICSLAKREEILFTEKKNEYKLDIKKPLGIILISLRNMTHQAAIQLHRIMMRKNNKN
jgi:excinuclease ABC subunit C